MNLVLDMNLPPAWAVRLSSHGFHAVHWSAVGDIRAADAEIMRWAAANDHVVVTHDLDFGAILAATGAAHPSVVQIRSDDLSFERVGAMVVSALRQAHNDLRQGALVSLDVQRARLRLLPLRSD